MSRLTKTLRVARSGSVWSPPALLDGAAPGDRVPPRRGCAPFVRAKKLRGQVCTHLGAVGWFALACVLLSAPPGARAAELPAVAVLDFQEQTGMDAGTGALLADLVRAELYLSETVALVDRSDIERIMNEQRLAISGLTDSTERSARVGKLLGVPIVWSGSVGRLGSTYLLTLNVIDVESAKVDRLQQIKTQSLDELAASIPRVTRELAQGDPYRAARFIVDGKRLYGEGQYAAAAAAFEQALKLHPEHDEARQLLAQARAQVRTPSGGADRPEPPPLLPPPPPVAAAPTHIIMAGSIEGLGVGAQPIPAWWDPPTEQAQCANRIGLPLAVEDGVGQRLVLVPPGRFLMGSGSADPSREDDEGPQHSIDVPYAYYAAATEVTNAAYQAFLTATGYEGGADADPDYLRHHRDWRRQAPPEDEHPVVAVSWRNAQAFCRWLTESERQAGRLGPREVYRLPTEAEWEYACRAGASTPWNFGLEVSNLGLYAWIRGNTRSTRPVGRRRPNAWGLFDLHGNVDEWSQSLKRPYPYRADDGRENLGDSGPRIVRGGSWQDVAKYCRSAHRNSVPPRRATVDRGFRVIRVVDAAR